jgi:pimeloyl-ACP methyl ester carboxylesterase
MSSDNKVSAAGLITSNAQLSREKFTETESILPFVLTHKTVANPALASWNAAPSNPCGLHCIDPALDVYYYVPTNAQAVVYVFHGGEGSAEMWITGEEEAALLGDLVRNGYAVVLLESTHRSVDRNWFFPDPERFDPANLNHPETPGSDDAWNATVNADEQLVRDVHGLLGYNTSTEVFLVGFSSGGKFASAMAYSLKLDRPALGDYYYTSPRTNTGGGLNVRAAAVYNNVGVPFYFGNYVSGPGDPAAAPLARQYDAPTIFNYGLNDPRNDPAEVAANANFLGTLPTPVPFESNLEEPRRLRADRFARVLGVSYVESRNLYAALVADPTYVDANGLVLPAANEAPAVLALSTGKSDGVKEQLKALRTEHHVSSQYHSRTVAFFNAHF